MKKRIIAAGGFIGILFSTWDSMVDHPDSASLSDHMKIGFIFHSVFNLKTLIYLLIGVAFGWIISVIINKISELHREWNDF
ncbi:hypothetical protein FW781_06460 (plasmid) [Chryseobacterium panacisoli]|uniref:Uncharacterized protein n=1 Tax=Chryseobacterium panacisoli TaxID=1807141 RepID=A0A5D8ZX86_9FLAO|nr:hypothetical protein [Chryseobacterium panacisoli]TZF99565.1 hypothetical protein FW781_06460 [Chryseobacterium panacisoli]